MTGFLIFGAASSIVLAALAEAISAAVRRIYHLLTRESAR